MQVLLREIFMWLFDLLLRQYSPHPAIEYIIKDIYLLTLTHTTVTFEEISLKFIQVPDEKIQQTC